MEPEDQLPTNLPLSAPAAPASAAEADDESEDEASAAAAAVAAEAVAAAAAALSSWDWARVSVEPEAALPPAPPPAAAAAAAEGVSLGAFFIACQNHTASNNRSVPPTPRAFVCIFKHARAFFFTAIKMPHMARGHNGVNMRGRGNQPLALPLTHSLFSTSHTLSLSLFLALSLPPTVALSLALSRLPNPTQSNPAYLPLSCGFWPGTPGCAAAP